MISDSKSNLSVSVANVAHGLFSLVIVTTVLCFGLTAYAQVERATITGTVTDANGAAIPEATVRVAEESTNVVEPPDR